MAVGSSVSLVLSVVVGTVVFSGMQMGRGWFASSQVRTLLGGYVGSLLFLLALTAVGNLETVALGKGATLKYPEVAACLLLALAAAACVHRVCATTCLIFSLIAFYYINRISQRVHSTSVQAAPIKKKGHK